MKRQPFATPEEISLICFAASCFAALIAVLLLSVFVI